ncbi:MAG: sigma 54-interacting transcriptional regulator [Lachnospiraceae bacterium]|nr:sigma 54-interacting transcriptional regulator [Lachnospiraceae bacterium]
MAINVAAVPENLLESELFGYEEGAFTGAKKGGRPGLFEFSHKGTLFLDEVEGMSQALQVKLLRVLQEREIMRVGGNRVIKIDVRIVAATNESLEEKVEEGTFRRDLYYRLNTLPIVIPTLAERGEDMFLIIESIKGELGGDFVLTEPVKDFLRDYSWPGNIRELRNIVEYFIYTGQPEITIEELPPTVFRRHSVKLRPVASSQPGSPAAPASPWAAANPAAPASPWAAVNPPAPASPWAAANPTAQSLPPVPETASPPGEKEFSPFWYILEQLYRASEGYTTIGRERILAGAKAKNLPLSQQIRRKRQVIIGAKLGLKGHLCQRKSVHASPGHDNQGSHYVIPGAQCRQYRHGCMHRPHDGEDNAPVSPPGRCPVHPGGFLQGNRDIYQVPGIQKQVHRHIKYHIAHNDTDGVGDSQLGSLLD